MKSTKIVVSFISLFCFLLIAITGYAMTSPNYKIDWILPLTGAGGGETGSINYKVNATLGQSVIGLLQSANYQIGLGYWYNIQPGRTYLPLILFQQ
ncbi:MAG: hypothetical protein HY892_16605 [Deltaproteobacteria bacterium]|nr:hypothetical protein [Deltaproteobacteria bacterium]